MFRFASYIVFLAFIPLSISASGCGGGASSNNPDLGLAAQSCGNGHLDASESCDDGNASNSDGCNAHCAWEVGEALCGNGVKENEECCDDGNNASGDGCSADCSLEKNNRPPNAPVLAVDPPDGAIWAPTRLYLSWSPASDPDAGDGVRYDVYFVEGNGISENAVPYKQGIESTHFILQASTDNRAEYFPDVVRPLYLEPNHTYTWKVCARDNIGASRCSPSRIFNTDDSVVGWWRFDENPALGHVCPGGQAGETVCDYSGKGNHGKPYGAPRWYNVNESRMLGGSLDFDGINDWVEVQNDNYLNLNSAFVLAASIKISSEITGVGGKIVSKVSQGVVGPIGYNIEVYPNQFRMGSFNDTSSSSSIADSLLEVGSVFRINGIYTGSESEISINGAVIDERLGSVNPGVNGSALAIGRLSPPYDFFLKGILSEVLIMNRAFNQSEIANDDNSIK